jgi:hypothetical protein
MFGLFLSNPQIYSIGGALSVLSDATARAWLAVRAAPRR